MKTILLPILLFLAGCSSVPHKYLPKESPGAKVWIEKGNGVASITNSKAVVVPQIGDVEDDIEVLFLVNNLSPNELVLRDSEFLMSVSDDGQNWKPLKTYDSQEYFSKAREEADSSVMWTEIFAISGARSASRGRSYSSGTYNGNVNGNSVSGSYQGTTQYYDPVAAQAAWANANRTIAEAKNKHGQRLADLEKFLMYEERIPPGQMGGGLVFFKRESGRFYKLDSTNQLTNGVSLKYERVKN